MITKEPKQTMDSESDEEIQKKCNDSVDVPYNVESFSGNSENGSYIRNGEDLARPEPGS